MTFDPTLVEPFDRAPHTDLHADLTKRWQQCVARGTTTKSLADFTDREVSGFDTSAYSPDRVRQWQYDVLERGYVDSLNEHTLTRTMRVIWDSWQPTAPR